MLITALNHQPDMANALLVLGDVYRGEARWDSACYYLHQAIEYGDIQNSIVPTDIYHPLRFKSTIIPKPQHISGRPNCWQTPLKRLPEQKRLPK